MSEPQISAPARHRIRAQASANDPHVMGFVLETALSDDSTVGLQPTDDAPLSRALFALDDIRRVEVVGATIWVQKEAQGDWTGLKAAIAGAIRAALDDVAHPLGEARQAEGTADPDETLLEAVRNLLEQQVNPAVAAHGGHIAAERVEAGAVYLRMSGGCQGCAASAATLRDGVERMLRAALPQITSIIDLTDHDAGETPFYAASDGPSPMLNRPVPPDVINREDGHLSVDPDYLAPRLGLTPEALRKGLQTGEVVGVIESGEGEDAGKTRIVLRSATRSWAAEMDARGAAREIPPPRPVEQAANKERDLATRLRAHLEGLEAQEVPITYGALARALGFWAPGSVRRITRALEVTMREDAAANRPFIASRVVSRGPGGLPGKGFFDLARSLGRGPCDTENPEAFHAAELTRLTVHLAEGARAQTPLLQPKAQSG